MSMSAAGMYDNIGLARREVWQQPPPSGHLVMTHFVLHADLTLVDRDPENPFDWSARWGAFPDVPA